MNGWIATVNVAAALLLVVFGIIALIKRKR